MKGAYRTASWILLIAIGAVSLAGYAAIILVSEDATTRRDAALLAGIGMAALIAGCCLLATILRGGSDVRMLPIWVGIVGFVGGIACGAYVSRSERWPALDPLLAVLAISSTFVVFAAITVRWSRGRRADRRIALGSTLWGMTVAPAVALALELVCATALIAGGALGLYIADAELLRTLSDGGIETAIEDSGNDLITMPTLILGIAAVYAVIAPLVEEFAKLLASVVFLRPADATQFDAFTAGVFAGLGFASVETLAYALAAGDQWPLLAAIRAPVAIIHVSAAAFAALGWYAGELSILRGYAMAALIHAGWNGLTVTVLLITAAVDDPESLSAAAAFATLVVFGAMTLLLTACSVWLVKTARKRGRETSEFDPPTQPSATIETSQKTERNPTIGRATLGSF